MRMATWLAAAAVFFVLWGGPASAATTTLDLEFSNGSGQDLRVTVRGDGFNSTQNLPTGGQVNFNIQDPAHFLSTRNYRYQVSVYDADGRELLASAEANENNIWDGGPKVTSCNFSECQGRLSCQSNKQMPDRGTCQYFITIGR